jgi:hypothetical protein
VASATGHKWKMRQAPVGATEWRREISAAPAGACASFVAYRCWQSLRRPNVPCPSGTGPVPHLLGHSRHQRATVTRRKVAGMEVASLLGLLFWLLNSSSSSFCRSADRPFSSAASKAFMVGP